MAINPIALFQNPGNSLIDILNGGNNVITGILDRAIQSGQNMVNNQMTQDSQLMNLRAQETALAQRRAENLQQNNEDAQRAYRSAAEFDMKFGANRADTAAAQSRASANDIFSQNLQRDTFDLNRSNIQADNTRQDAVLKTRQDEVAATRAFNEGVVNQPVGATAPAQEPGIIDRVKSFFTGGTTETPQSTDYFTQIQQARAKQAAAKQLKDPQAYNAALAEEGAAMQAQVESRDSAGPTALQLSNAERAQRTEQRITAKAQQDARDKEVETLVGDTGAFVPQKSLLPEEATNAQKAEAAAYDKNRPLSEFNSAKNYSKDAYVNLVPNLSEPQKQKRLKLWEYANPQAVGNEPEPSAGKTLDSATARQFMLQANGDKEKARQLAKEAGYSF